MKKLIVLMSIISIINCSCSGQYNTLIQKCAQTDSIEFPIMYFQGFLYSEMQNILVKELNNGSVVDSFYMQPYKKDYDSVYLTDDGCFTFKFLNVKDTYLLYMIGYLPFKLSNMKTFLITNYNNFGNPVYMCEMRQYDLNGVTYQDGHPKFIKDSTNRIPN